MLFKQSVEQTLT